MLVGNRTSIHVCGVYGSGSIEYRRCLLVHIERSFWAIICSRSSNVDTFITEFILRECVWLRDESMKLKIMFKKDINIILNSMLSETTEPEIECR